MSRFLNCCFTIPISRETPDSQVSLDAMEKKSDSKDTGNFQSEKPGEGFMNIILNHDFSEGLHLWHPNCCEGSVVPFDFSQPEGLPGSHFAVITNRTQCWQGLEQDIISRVRAGPTYSVIAWVGISGAPQCVDNVVATLRLEHQDSSVSYSSIARDRASMGRWVKLEGTFSFSIVPKRATFYLEGPSPGVNLLVRSVVIWCPSFGRFDTRAAGAVCDDDGDGNIIQNPNFDDGLSNWSGRGCGIELHDSMGEGDGKILPAYGKFFASTKDRTQNVNGIQQEITGLVQRKLAYDVTAVVRIFGNNVTSDDVRATLWVQTADNRQQYITVGICKATNQSWVELSGKFLLNGSLSRVVIYLESPSPGTDILLNKLVVKHAAKPSPATPPVIKNPAYGVDIISNTNLSDGTTGWFPLGNCTLTVATGSPHILPPMAEASIGARVLSGRYIHTTNRTQTWMGPAQMMTDKLTLYLTYQVSAWVSVGSGATGPQTVSIALSVDSQWVNGGQVEINDDQWHEIGGSFRIEKQPVKVMLYVQGPDPGIDLMTGGLQVFAVDRCARFRHLKMQTEKIRKRDVTLKFTAPDSGTVAGARLTITQTQNSFPLGSCVSRANIDNEDFVDFFTKNFNWAVFGNELKWYWTEAQRGNLNYRDADELLAFCESRSILVRGHCIFWEVESAVQPWIKALSKPDLAAAVQNRLSDLLTRYKGKFMHYDVNNEMMHGSFYQDRLGPTARADMFRAAAQIDPAATLFVNDYHVEDGCDSRASPEKYTAHILGLRRQGAGVGAIGIQGHIDTPVGTIVRSALDRLAVLGLPIWFTEVDVSSENEFVRADDLEVMLREVYAHPAVEGVVLWGFWELFMSRENAHLVDAEGEVNEAGKRFLKLREEWQTRAHGLVGQDSVYRFRGFHGAYGVEVAMGSEKMVVRKFVVEQGEDPVVITISL